MKGRRALRALLRLLPFDFRTDYGAELERTFVAQQREAATAGERARLWRETAGSILAIGPREHVAQFREDVRYALRGMRRDPGFVAIALLTLALGTGANTAVFGIVYSVLLAPLPYPEPARLMSVMNRWDGQPRGGLSNPEYLDYAESSRTMEIAAMAPGMSALAADGADAEQVQSAAVTSNVFDVLGRPPALGRPFTSEEVRTDADVVMLAHATWQQRFGGDPTVLGRTITVNGIPSTIVGVLHEDFALPVDISERSAAALLVPLPLDPAAPRMRRGGHYLTGVGRLRPGVTREAAAAEMDAIIQRLIREYPDQHNQGNFGIAVVDLRTDLFGDSKPVLWMLACAVALVLLLACANVANLMLVRGESRRRELSVRSALGASRFRMVRQLVSEALVLGGLATLLGLAVAYACNQAVLAVGPDVLPRLSHLSISRPVLLFASVLALGATVLFGLLPAWQLSGADAGDALKEGTRGGSSGRAGVRRALVVCQVSVAVVLLIGAGLLARSYVRVLGVPSGIDTGQVITARVAAPPTRYPNLPAVTSFYDRLLERLRSIPGVEVAGASSGLPLALVSGDWSFDIEGRPRVNGRRPGRADWYVVTPGYFEALRIPLEAGRLPQASDTQSATPVIFLNRSAARTLFPGQDPLGKRVRLANTTGPEQPWRIVAGIVGDVRHRGLDQSVRDEMFIPFQQFLHFSAGVQARAMSLVVRTSGDPGTLVSAMRAELRRIDPEIPLSDARTMRDVFSLSVADRQLHLLLVGAFAALAILLATLGVYGVIASDAQQRTREIGIRVALGASRGSVISLMVGRGLALVGVGAGIGLVAAAGITGRVSSLLFEVGPRDLAVFASVAALLALSGAAASYVPAWRASRVDPLSALRHE